MSELKMWHKRHPDFEAFDSVTIDVVPRYKTSGLSGDEWRVAAVIRLWFKGEPVAERGYRDIESALKFLPAFTSEAASPIPTRVIELERESCDQPGCAEKAVTKCRLKKEYSDRGEELVMREGVNSHYRQFCQRHLQRGDCGLEDSDSNYEVVSGPGPDQARGYEDDVVEARRVEVRVGSLEELPAAIEAARREAEGKL